MRNIPRSLLSLRFNMNSLTLGLETGGIIVTSRFPSIRISNPPISVNKLVGWDFALKRIKNKKKKTEYRTHNPGSAVSLENIKALIKVRGGHSA